MSITRKIYIYYKNAYGVIGFFIYITLGKPEVDSQSKKDARIRIQTNELAVEKEEKGMSCMYKSSLWFLGALLVARVPYSIQVRSLRRVIAKLKAKKT